MSYQFSQPLRERLKRYLEECHDLIVSDETADEYLNSWADLYLSFNETEKERTLPLAKDVPFFT